MTQVSTVPGRPGDVVITVEGPGFRYWLTGTPPPPSVYVGALGDPVILSTCRQ